MQIKCLTEGSEELAILIIDVSVANVRIHFVTSNPCGHLPP